MPTYSNIVLLLKLLPKVNTNNIQVIFMHLDVHRMIVVVAKNMMRIKTVRLALQLYND